MFGVIIYLIETWKIWEGIWSLVDYVDNLTTTVYLFLLLCVVIMITTLEDMTDKSYVKSFMLEERLFLY